MNADIAPAVIDSIPAELRARPQWVCWLSARDRERQSISSESTEVLR